MIGLKLPRLFYGRKKRQQIIGVRADFCEFCVCVSRHWVISFQSAPTVFFIPLNFDEFNRESRCEICRTQFPIAPSTVIRRLNGEGRTAFQDQSIGALIAETNPDIVSHAAEEVREMVSRSGGTELMKANRLKNLVRNYEVEYQQHVREFWPQLAIGSIQATILGLALTSIVPVWLALAFACSGFLFAVLYAWLLLRRRILRALDGGAGKLCAMANISTEEMLSLVEQLAARFPRAAAILQQQLLRSQIQTADPFEPHEDFVPLLEPSTRD